MPPNYFEIKVFSSVCQGISHLHMNGRYCDLSVTVGTRSFSCHRLVLASVSEYFRDALPDENVAGMICIQDERVPEEIFALILDAVYKGTNIVKDIPTAKTLVRAAVFLKIRFLIELCERFLRGSIDIDNFVDLWKFGDQYDLNISIEGAAQRVSSRFDTFKKSGSFLQLPKQFFFAILSSDSLQASSDEDVCKALLKWVEYDVEHRSYHLPEILPYIRFCTFSENYIWKLKYNIALFEMKIKDAAHRHGHKVDAAFLSPVEDGYTMVSASNKANSFRQYMNENGEYIQEAMQVNYETLQNINSSKKTKILSRQERIKAADNMKRVTVLIDRTSETGIQIFKLGMYPDKDRPGDVLDTFTPHPVDCGPGFASCVWRNELYVSGGSEKPKFFAVYNSGIDKWKILPDLPSGREQHAMTVVNWNIYVLGGMEESPDGQKVPAARVMTYNIKSKTWRVTANLFKAVQQVCVAVLGQKIYVFGGRDADDNVTSLVQCFDTLTGCMFHAGQLPSPTCGACPLVNAGIIYLVRGEGDVLQMRERSIGVTDEDFLQEQFAKQEPKVLETCVYPLQPEQTDVEHSEAQMQNDFSLQRNIKEGKIPTADSIRFKHIAEVSRRQYFSAVMQGGQIQVCGGQNQAGTLLQDVEEVDPRTREVTIRAGILPRPMSNFGVHLLNVPTPTEMLEFKFSFRLDTLLKKGAVINSTVVVFNKVSWYLQFRVREQYLYVQLYTAISSHDRFKKLVKYSLWVVPTKGGPGNIYSGFPFPRKECKSSEKWEKLFPIQKLTDPEEGYNKDGQVTLHVIITALSKW